MDNRKIHNRHAGRPTKMNPEILQKLEEAFCQALPDTEACVYTGIAPSTLYAYQERNPEFSERKRLLKMTPNIAARKTIVNSLGEVKVAQWWLEKKDPDFKHASKVEHAGKIQIENVKPPSPAMLEAMEVYKAKRRQELQEEARRILVD